MRDVHETDAVHRDEDDPFIPRDGRSGRRRSRSAFDWGNVSHALMPTALRDRAIAVSVQTNKRRYRREEPVLFRVTLENRIPFPVALKTASPVLWSWAVDGVEQASHLVDEPPAEPGLLRFRRSERKTFERRWPQRIRDRQGRWNPVDPGEYELTAWVNVDGATGRGLAAGTTVEVE